MYIMSRLCPAGRPAWQNLNVGHDAQTVQPNLCIPAMLTGTIDSSVIL